MKEEEKQMLFKASWILMWLLFTVDSVREAQEKIRLYLNALNDVRCWCFTGCQDAVPIGNTFRVGTYKRTTWNFACSSYNLLFSANKRESKAVYYAVICCVLTGWWNRCYSLIGRLRRWWTQCCQSLRGAPPFTVMEGFIYYSWNRPMALKKTSLGNAY